jgi:uncharacterized protein (DUF302 family)
MTSQPPTSNPENGIVTIPSHHSVDETVEMLEKILQAKGVNIFALIDHSGEAEKAGMQMRPTRLLIFGNPKAGTPLMVAAPSVAPAHLQERHRLPQELVQNIALVEGLATRAAE